MGEKIAYLFVTYILWASVFYTSINIPYGSMASAVSADPADRQSLSTFRIMGGTLAGMGAGSDMGGADLSKMLGGFTILRLTNRMGSMTEKKITKEMLLALNEQLNQIAKP